jgi:HlyD family secretion protein
MKKLIVLIIVVVVAFGLYRLSTYELTFAAMEGETKRLERGDLKIPINATGEIEPLSRHQIKSEASGEVIGVYFQPGDMVSRGDLIIRLQKDEEQRSVDRAKAEVSRTRATLESARTKLRRLKTVGIDQATERIEQIKPQVAYAAFQKGKFDQLIEEQRCTPEEHLRAGTQLDELKARQRLAEADLEDAKIAIELAEQDVIQAQAFFDQSETALRDAEERLLDTDVHSPVDGMVVEVNTQVGEVIQGGKTTFTAGTVLAIVADVSKKYVRAQVDEADIGVVRELAPEIARPGHVPPVDHALASDRAAEAAVASMTGGAEGSDLGSDELVVKALGMGTPVKVHVEAFRDEPFEGMIERIHPEPDSKVSSVVTYRVDILLTSENRGKLMAGMQADVEFTAQAALDVVLVPHEAIRRGDGDGLGVYVPNKDPKTQKEEPKFVKVRIGLDNGMYAEVLSGLSEGDVVYTVVPQKIGRDRDAGK